MRYKHFIIKKFINTIIKSGNKFKALNYFCKFLELIKQNKKGETLLNVFTSLEVIKPTVSYRKLKKGGGNFIYLPKLLTTENQYKQAINWLLKFSKVHKKDTLPGKLATEFLLSLKKQGGLIKEKNRIYYLLMDSRPFLYLIKYYM